MKMTINLDRVKDKIELPDGGCVILLDMLGKAGEFSKEEVARNVFRLDDKGEVEWQIYSKFDSKGVPFTAIEIENALSAYRWDGGNYSVDIESGEATPLQLER
jgi:hypothetical protein